jgi:hypothetical protein
MIRTYHKEKTKEFGASLRKARRLEARNRRRDFEEVPVRVQSPERVLMRQKVILADPEAGEARV